MPLTVEIPQEPDRSQPRLLNRERLGALFINRHVRQALPLTAQNRGIPWRRSYLTSGKRRFVRADAGKVDSVRSISASIA